MGELASPFLGITVRSGTETKTTLCIKSTPCELGEDHHSILVEYHSVWRANMRVTRHRSQVTHRNLQEEGAQITNLPHASHWIQVLHVQFIQTLRGINPISKLLYM